MRTILALFVTFLLYFINTQEILHASVTEEVLAQISENLPAKYCPMRNFDGSLFCPRQQRLSNIAEVELSVNTLNSSVFLFSEDMPQSVNSKSKIKVHPLTASPYVISGFGYDRVKREIKFPVLPSNGPSRVNSQNHIVKKFNQVHELISHIFAQSNWFEAGAYSMNNEFLNNLYYQFGDSNINIGVTQKHFNTHVTQVASNTPLVDFVEAVNSLPAYNQNTKHLYRMIIDFWGTDIATTVNHGGVLFQQTLIKACYGGSVNEGMVGDIESAIKKIPPGQYAYLKYRKLGFFNARGGNPEYGMDRPNERINSFESAPAPVNFNVIPLWSVVPNAERKVWLQQAIQEYLAENNVHLESIKASVEARKLQTYKASQPVYSFHTAVEQGNPVTVFWEACTHVKGKNWVYTPRCVVNAVTPNIAAGGRSQINTQSFWDKNLHYTYFMERDGGSGVLRLAVFLKGNPHHNTNWVKTGCVQAPQFGFLIIGGRLRVDLSQRLKRISCIDCLPVITQAPAAHGTRHLDLQCVCPTF